MPLVSIIIPAYNAAPVLPQAIESCLAQTHPQIEIIVVNDGSTDDTPQVARSYPQVICLDQTNKGLAGARNTGILYATGEYIQFLDADDMLLPDKIRCCVETFQADSAADVVYTDYEIRTPDMKNISPNPKPDVVMGEGDILNLLVHTTSTLFRVPCPLVKSSLVRQVDGFSLGMQGVEDWHFWIKLAAIGASYRFLPQVLVWYRDSPASMSKDRLLMTRSRLHAVQALQPLDLPSNIDLPTLIAGRHHALAMVLWEMNRRAEAREHFQSAIQISPQHQQIRRLLKFCTHFLPAVVIHSALGLGVKIKSVRQSN